MKLSIQNKIINRTFVKSFLSGTLIFAVIILATTIFTKTAHAGLFSFVNSILGGEQASAKVSSTPGTLNSQTINLLQAHANFNPTSKSLAEAVPVDDGQTLVPDIAANATIVDEGSSVISTYIVRSGDNLSSIAKMFNVSVNTVLWANNLTSKSAIHVGDTLVILPISGINYTVKKGDTLKGIALQNKADLEDILNYNDITLASAISVGQNIIIPYAEPPVVKVTTTSSGKKITKAPYEPLLDGLNWPSMPGYFIRPVAGGIKTQELHGHNAIDIGGVPIGTPIVASAAGTVIISRANGGWNGGYGNYVVVSHSNGTQTLYAHMSKSFVTVGQSVDQGQKIGAIGNTGMSTGPHIHFEIRGAKNPF